MTSTPWSILTLLMESQTQLHSRTKTDYPLHDWSEAPSHIWLFWPKLPLKLRSLNYFWILNFLKRDCFVVLLCPLSHLSTVKVYKVMTLILKHLNTTWVEQIYKDGGCKRCTFKLSNGGTIYTTGQKFENKLIFTLFFFTPPKHFTL